MAMIIQTQDSGPPIFSTAEAFVRRRRAQCKQNPNLTLLVAVARGVS
jgi:hypothetical protein